MLTTASSPSATGGVFMYELMPVCNTAISQTHMRRELMEDNRIRSLASRKFNYILFYPPYGDLPCKLHFFCTQRAAVVCI